MAFWKESMINWLSNLINRNRLAAKISQVLCSSGNTIKDEIYIFWDVKYYRHKILSQKP